MNSPDAGSGQSLLRCEHLTLSINKHNSLNAGSYMKLSDEITNKKACIHFENKDEYCFSYSIRYAIYFDNKKQLNHPKRIK